MRKIGLSQCSNVYDTRFEETNAVAFPEIYRGDAKSDKQKGSEVSFPADSGETRT